MPATVSADADKPIPARPAAAAAAPRSAVSATTAGGCARRAASSRWPWRASRSSRWRSSIPRCTPAEQGTQCRSGRRLAGLGAVPRARLRGLPAAAPARRPGALSAFARPRVRRAAGCRWPASRVLVLAAAGLLQQSADTFVAQRVTRGGILATGGWVGLGADRVACRARSARSATWLLLLAAVPVGVLLVTQASYAGRRPARHGAPGAGCAARAAARAAAAASGARRRGAGARGRAGRRGRARRCRSSWSRACRAAG